MSESSDVSRRYCFNDALIPLGTPRAVSMNLAPKAVMTMRDGPHHHMPRGQFQVGMHLES
jgi:hypothetical protein